MARLTRVHQKVFASNASNNGVFGSLQAGNPTTSNDVATLQSLSAFENGWDDAAYSGDKLPPLEEFQGVQYGISYQQAYMLQEGIAEWEANTPYYKGSLAKTISGSSFKLYCSLADNNTGNIVTNTTYWKLVMDSDAGYFVLTANNTATGNNSFTGTNTFVTPNANDNSQKPATTEWCRTNMTGVPDYANRVEITSPYTPTKNGIIIAHGAGGYANAWISTNDDFVITMAQCQDSTGGQQTVWAIVKSGDTYKFGSSGGSQYYFVPFV